MEENNKKGFRISIGCYLLALCMALGMAAALIFWKNPFILPEIDAGDQTQVFANYSVNDYVEIKHMDLVYTGYYSLDVNENLCGYYYIGSIGDTSVYVEIQAKPEDEGLSKQMPNLEQYTFVGEIKDGADILDDISEKEGYSLSQYFDEYQISDHILVENETRRYKDMICYFIAILLIFALLVVGKIVDIETHDEKER